MAATKNHKDDAQRTAHRSPRLTATARAQAQRDALTRRVQKRATHLIRYGALQLVDGKRVHPSWENFPWREFYQECHRHPIKGVNRVTGLPYVR
jgi:hypothetical protein